MAKTKPELHRALQRLGLILGLALALSAGAESPSVLVSTAPVQEQTVTETLTAFGVLDPDPACRAHQPGLGTPRAARHARRQTARSDYRAGCAHAVSAGTKRG
jgi:hypothetical protein